MNKIILQKISLFFITALLISSCSSRFCLWNRQEWGKEDKSEVEQSNIQKDRAEDFTLAEGEAVYRSEKVENTTYDKEEVLIDTHQTEPQDEHHTIEEADISDTDKNMLSQTISDATLNEKDDIKTIVQEEKNSEEYIPTAGKQVIHSVNIPNGSIVFKPSNITVNAGDIIKWINNDFSIDAHIFQTVPGTNPYDKDKDEIPVVNLYGGQVYEKRFDKIGIYPYFCFIHPGMKGEITVLKHGQNLADMKKEVESLTSKKKNNNGSKAKLEAKEMVLIKEGGFIMGSPNEPTEGPVRQENLPDFYIDKYEVTNEEFEEFVDMSGYKPEGDWHSKYKKGKEKNPVVNLTYNDVMAYAKWAGKRLPTEAEWEKAARGLDRRLWPWGNDFDNEIVNVFGPDPYPETSPVGSFPNDVSPYGVYDMGGNVTEWTSDRYLPYKNSPASDYPDFNKNKMTIRGGSFSVVDENEARTHKRGGNNPQNALISLGFRLVKDNKK